MSSRFYAVIAALAGGSSVAMGAFTAHTLQNYLDAGALKTMQTGAQYQMYHALALLAVAILLRDVDSRRLKYSAMAFVLGMLLFCGSLYTLALTKVQGFGIITPIGGVLLIGGWLLMATFFMRSRRRRKHGKTDS